MFHWRYVHLVTRDLQQKYVFLVANTINIFFTLIMPGVIALCGLAKPDFKPQSSGNRA